MSAEVRDNAEQQRFELDTDDEPAVAFYRWDGDVLVLFHTEVPRELRSQGIGEMLVRGVLDEVRRPKFTWYSTPLNALAGTLLILVLTRQVRYSIGNPSWTPPVPRASRVRSELGLSFHAYVLPQHGSRCVSLTSARVRLFQGSLSLFELVYDGTIGVRIGSALIDKLV